MILFSDTSNNRKLFSPQRDGETCFNLFPEISFILSTYSFTQILHKTLLYLQFLTIFVCFSKIPFRFNVCRCCRFSILVGKMDNLFPSKFSICKKNYCKNSNQNKEKKISMKHTIPPVVKSLDCKYSRTCFKRPLVGEWKTGHIRQVATYSRFQHED